MIPFRQKNIKVTENVSDRTQKEYTLRPLTRIKSPDEQREVYQKAVETAPEGRVTAKHSVLS